MSDISAGAWREAISYWWLQNEQHSGPEGMLDWIEQYAAALSPSPQRAGTLTPLAKSLRKIDRLCAAETDAPFTQIAAIRAANKQAMADLSTYEGALAAMRQYRADEREIKHIAPFAANK